MKEATKKPTGRKRTSLSPKLDKRLAAYIAAGSAAGAGFLALAQPVEAEIIYTPANVKIHDGHFKFHLTPNGPNNVGFRQSCSRDVCNLSAYTETGNAIQAIYRDSYPYALALKGGSTVGQGQFYAGGFMAFTILGSARGSWFASGARYLGVRFQVNAETHYGWMRLVNSSQHGATLTGYAYETIPGKEIRAGYRKDGPDDLNAEPQDGAPAESVPTSSLGPLPLSPSQPGSLGMLALGAESISLWRDAVPR